MSERVEVSLLLSWLAEGMGCGGGSVGVGMWGWCHLDGVHEDGHLVGGQPPLAEVQQQSLRPLHAVALHLHQKTGTGKG